MQFGSFAHLLRSWRPAPCIPENHILGMWYRFPSFVFGMKAPFKEHRSGVAQILPSSVRPSGIG
jgi:hypothetical protein